MLDELRPLGAESYKKVMRAYGVREPFFGVKIGDLQKIRRRLKRDHPLALDLYGTGNYDAMYLAGLIADDARMTRRDLQRWVEQAYCRPLAGTVVPQVAAGAPDGCALALEWMESAEPLIASAGWAAAACVISVRDDAALPPAVLHGLLRRVRKRLLLEPDEVRYHMNGFVIAAGCFVPELTEEALAVGAELGPVPVDMGETSCQVPFAPDYIRKVQQRGAIGKKRPSAKC